MVVAAHYNCLPKHVLTNSDLDVKNGFVRYTAVLKQHRHIRVVKHGISFPNSLNLLGFKGLPGSTQLSYKTAIKFPDFEFVMIDICSPF